MSELIADLDYRDDVYDDARQWFPASADPPALRFYELIVGGEDTVFYADEQEAWEATRGWHQDKGAVQIMLTRYEWPLTGKTVLEVTEALVNLITAARTTYQKDNTLGMVYDGVKRAEVVERVCESFGVAVLFLVGHGAGTDVNDAPDWIRWASPDADDDGGATQQTRPALRSGLTANLSG